MSDSVTQYGFRWGPVTVGRVAEYRGRRVISITTDAGVRVEVCVSAKGHNVRVWKGDEEMMPSGKEDA